MADFYASLLAGAPRAGPILPRALAIRRGTPSRRVAIHVMTLGKGNTKYTTNGIEDRLKQLEGIFDQQVKVFTKEFRTLQILYSFKDGVGSAVERLQTTETLLEVWNDILHYTAGDNRAILNWRFKMSDGGWRFTSYDDAIPATDVDVDAILQVLEYDSDGSS